MTQQSKVREILEFVWNLSPHNKDRMAEAEQALYDAMLGVIKPKNAIDRFTRLNALFGKKGE